MSLIFSGVVSHEHLSFHNHAKVASNLTTTWVLASEIKKQPTEDLEETSRLSRRMVTVTIGWWLSSGPICELPALLTWGQACAEGHRHLPGGAVSSGLLGHPISAQTSWPTLGVTGCKAPAAYFPRSSQLPFLAWYFQTQHWESQEKMMKAKEDSSGFLS